MSSQKSVSQKMLLNQLSEYEKQMEELMKKLREIELKESESKKINVFQTKEQIVSKKTQKQLDVENNSLLFKRKNMSDKLYVPYRTGIQTSEKRYIDMFNYILIPREGRREGKVKYINECLNLNVFKKSRLNEIKSEKVENNQLNIKKINLKNEHDNSDKIILALNKKKLNDLKIYARDMKINGYSVMKKETLVNSIYGILKKKEIEKEKKEKEEKEKENVNIKKSKNEILKECDIDTTIDYDENDLNGNNDENLFFDDDEINDDDSVDYEC